MIARIICITALVSLIAFFHTGTVLAEDASNNLSEETNPMILTKEYMMEHCKLTEEEFSGIDFDDFVSFFNLTPEDLDQFSGASLLSLYRSQRDQYNGTDYSVIYQQAEGKLQQEDIPQIDTVIWEIHSGNRNLSMAADLEQQIVFGCEGYCLDHCCEENRLAELTENDLAFIRDAVSACGIAGWENSYIGTSEGTTGHFAWMIGIRLDSGKCFSYSGSGVLSSNTPASMKAFCSSLWDRFAKEQ